MHLSLRRRPLSSRRCNPRRDFLGRRQFAYEPLEHRWLLAIDLSLAGTQTLVGGANIDASNDHASQQQNMALDINPVNPLHVTGVSEKNTPTIGTSLGLYRSTNGGTSWTTTSIDNSVDGLGAGATRFHPVLAYDTAGTLYVAYGVNDGINSNLVVAASTDDGATFMQVHTVDSIASIFGGVDRFGIGTGPDGLGHQAVYVAYTKSTIGFQRIEVVGSNDGGNTFTGVVDVSDFTLHAVTSAHASVGPTGQLYVSWFDTTDLAVRFDRDLDGLFIGGNTFGADVTVVDNSTPRPTLGGNFNLFNGLIVPAAPTHGISTDPELDVDRSGKLATDGNLYISFVDLFSAPNSDTDIYVARSINQGANWSFVTVGITGSTEFMPSIDVDQASGSVNLLYYSTAGDTATGNDDVNVMLSTSIDAGLTYTGAQQLTSAASRASVIVGGNDFGDYNGLAVLDGTLQGLWADNRGPSIEVEAFTASASYNSATDGNVLTITGTAGDDTVLIRLSAANHAFVEVVVNGQLQYAGLLATLDSTLVNTLDGSDTLTIDNSNGVVNLSITYDGGTSAGDNDKLAITGNPGSIVQRETYLAGAAKGAGTWILDPDGSRGPGVNAAGNGDELTVVFSNLEPVDSDVPALFFDVILNTADNNGTVQDGGQINGANALELHDNGATFESVRFANKLTARIMGNSGADTLTDDYTVASAALFGLELYGHVAADVVGQPADDNASDTLSVLRNAILVAHIIAGNGGDDNFTVGNGDLSLILSPVLVIGGDGVDALVVNDATRVVPVDYVVNPPDLVVPTIAICTSPGPPPVRTNIATFDGTLETARLNGTQDINRFDVTPSADTEFTIDGQDPSMPPGDLLSIRFAGTTNRQLVFTNQATGTGMWTFGNRKNVDFTHIERFNFFPVVVYSAEAAAQGKPTVKVVDAELGTVVTTFQAYESTYRQGVRVAVGDVNGDGIPEVITAPGRIHSPLVEVWSLVNATTVTPPTLIESFVAYNPPYAGGVNLAVGDVNGDGLNDLITRPLGARSSFIPT